MRIAVTGATGRVGGQVVALLAADHDVVALQRRASADPGGPVADYANPCALRAALDGVEVLVMISSDGPVAQVITHHANIIRAAADRAVGHVVALSGLDADLRSPFCYAVANGYTERLLRDSGCRFSIARASLYTEFFLALAGTGPEVRLPAADGRISLVTRADVARSLAALAASPPTSRAHDITGPESLDVATIAAATGSRYVEIDATDYVRSHANEDPWWTYAYTSLLAAIRQQRFARVSDNVRRLTGNTPTTLTSILNR